MRRRLLLNTHLATHAFAVGTQPKIADLSMCGYLVWPNEFGQTGAVGSRLFG